MALLLLLARTVAADPPAATPGLVDPNAPPIEVTIEAPEPRYVAPTQRDRIGRIWAPVMINGKGPFRLVLDTGANRSVITPAVADALQLVPDPNAAVTLRGVTGAATVATVQVNSLEVGDLILAPVALPIVADAFGGAEGVLGNEGLLDKRITIEFHKDRISIRRSKNERAGFGFEVVPVQITRGRVMVTNARVGDVRVKAVIDTGAQQTTGNLALRNLLSRQRIRSGQAQDEIFGVTGDMQQGLTLAVPPINFGSLQIRSANVTFVDLYIFEQWKLLNEPALIIGMDVLGLLDTLILDYKRRELQLRR